MYVKYTITIVSHLSDTNTMSLHPNAVDKEAEDVTIFNLPSPPSSVIAFISNSAKVVDDSPEGGSIVTGWDSSMLRSKCLRSSPGFDPSVTSTMDELCKTIFPPDQWWAPKQLLLDALQDYAKIAGFRMTSNHNHIRCSRFGDCTTARKYSGGDSGRLAQGCSMIFF